MNLIKNKVKVISLLILLSATIFPLSSIGKALDEWKKYPYKPNGTKIVFPKDEGSHHTDPSVTMEWWYTNFTLNDSSGKSYSVMICFFKPVIGISLRLFNISTSDNNKIYTATKIGFLASKEGSLDITHTNASSLDHFYVKKEKDGTLIPFNYVLDVHGKQNTSVHLEMEPIKPPFIVGENGYVQVGQSGHSWYYSLTRMKTTGTIQIGGKKIKVEGIGWMDHQWGPFMVSPVPLMQKDSYEWFSVQLDNGEEYMVSNIFDKNNRLQKHKGFGGLGWMLSDSSTGSTVDFQLKRLAFWKPPTSDYYSIKWQILEPVRKVNLIITPDFKNQLIPLPNIPLGKFYFWEGSCAVEGTVAGKKVKGKAFAELVHKFKKPQLQLKLPLTKEKLQGKIKISWSVQNPDDGNPLKYRLFYRKKDKEFKLLTDNIDKDYYLWDTTNLKNGEYSIKLVAFSVDEVIYGMTSSKLILIQNENL
ncbi:MAG: lipocalin-like domain-containing protein [Verrucomicrobiota bacterium]|nr:lipocalin-like domain-containing protein [Verrucomicrobiota bacterium]